MKPRSMGSETLFGILLALEQKHTYGPRAHPMVFLYWFLCSVH